VSRPFFRAGFVLLDLKLCSSLRECCCCWLSISVRAIRTCPDFSSLAIFVFRLGFCSIFAEEASLPGPCARFGSRVDHAKDFPVRVCLPAGSVSVYVLATVGLDSLLLPSLFSIADLWCSRFVLALWFSLQLQIRLAPVLVLTPWFPGAGFLDVCRWIHRFPFTSSDTVSRLVFAATRDLVRAYKH
jgi:hypothetical protein